MKKRIILLNYEYPPLGGGAANATYNILQSCKNSKDLDIVLVTSSLDQYTYSLLAPNIKIYALDIHKNWKNPHHQSYKDLLIYSRKAYRYTKKLLKQQKYDVLHAFFGIPCGYLAMRLSKIYKIPYIVSLRWSDVPGYSKKYALLDFLVFSRLSKRIWKHAKSVIANSLWLKQLAYKTSPYQDIHVIPNGVHIPEHQSIQPDNNRFTVLYVGRLTARKQVDLLIQKYQHFKKRYSNVRLWLVWWGDMALQLQKIITETDEITFFWELSHQEVEKIYPQVDVYVLPSKNEGMSNTLLEAMAAWLPVIITDVWWTNELWCENWRKIKTDCSDLDYALSQAYHSWKDNTLCSLWLKSKHKVKSMTWIEVVNQYKKFW